MSELESAIGIDLLRSAAKIRPSPTIAGRYRIRDFLGRGATGIVVAAVDLRLDREVALKLGTATVDRSMVTEAQALAKLDHPNIVPVFDAEDVDATFDGRPFRVRVVSMRLIAGKNGRAWLNERTRQLDEILAAFHAAGSGLAAAHSRNVVHRDFKPDNFIVGDDGAVRVIDFAFAVPASLDGSTGQHTPTAVAGTDAYMAPEARVGQAGRRSDQFSFAVSLVEAITGRPGPPGEIRPYGMPRGLWSALRKATSPDTSRRYRTMAPLLRRVSGAKRNPTRVAVLWMAVLAAVLALIATGYFPAHEESYLHRLLRPVRLFVDGLGQPAPARRPIDTESPHGDAAAGTPAPGVAPTPDASRDPLGPDADVPISLGVDACPVMLGTFDFRTDRIADDDERVVRHGRYALVVGRTDAGAPSVRITKIGSGMSRRGDDHPTDLTDVRARLAEDCHLYVDSVMGDRAYHFHFSFSGARVVGEFSARGGPFGEFGGSLEGNRGPERAP